MANRVFISGNLANGSWSTIYLGCSLGCLVIRIWRCRNDLSTRTHRPGPTLHYERNPTRWCRRGEPMVPRDFDWLSSPCSQAWRSLIIRFMGPTWGPPGAAGVRWVPCGPHELAIWGVDHHWQSQVWQHRILETNAGCTLAAQEFIWLWKHFIHIIIYTKLKVSNIFNNEAEWRIMSQ